MKPTVTYADRCATINVMKNVALDLILLRAFGENQVMTIGRWESHPLSQRNRFLHQGYVFVSDQAVYLRANAINMLSYREGAR